MSTNNQQFPNIARGVYFDRDEENIDTQLSLPDTPMFTVAVNVDVVSLFL